MKLISVRTFDSLTRTRDARLNAEVLERNPDALGSMVWTGYSKVLADLNAMPQTDRARMARRILDSLTEFGMDDEPDVSSTATGDSLNAAQRKAHGQPRVTTAGASVQSIQAAQNDYWRGRSAEQATVGKPWGSR